MWAYLETSINSQRDAETLAARLRHYWRERGHNITTRVEYHEGAKKFQHGFYSIRSDMLNGLPRANP